MKTSVKVALTAGLAVAALAVPASARHSWGGYHWARTANPVTVPVGDNVDSRWDQYLVRTVQDWNQSAVIESALVGGQVSPATCDFVPGTIQVCNGDYGSVGWLGIASIEIAAGNHITGGTTKLNDTYYNQAKYNTPAWRMFVTCQEVGHNYGLAHQNEAFNNPNVGSCMDYTNSASGGGKYGPSNEHPNTHDYDQLASIYAHLDGGTSTTTRRSNNRRASVGNTPEGWGKAVRADQLGRPDMFIKPTNTGTFVVTHVYWAEGEGPRGHHHDH